MNKLSKIKLTVFIGILTIAAVSYKLHLLPYKAVWLWAPVIAFAGYGIDEYAKKRGMILSDEMTESIIGKTAWMTFQGTILFLFLAIIYYDTNRIQVDPRYILAYTAGFMGITFVIFNTYFNFQQGVYE